MTEKQKIQILKKLTDWLDCFDKKAKQEVLWKYLTDSLSGDNRRIQWLLEKVGEFINTECDRIISPFQ